MRVTPLPAENTTAVAPMHTSETTTGSIRGSMPGDAGEGSSGGASTTMSPVGAAGTKAFVISHLPVRRR
ncbi:hypothetical protein MUNTM_28830 [Mycobacterium sp. MUNTM1]